MNSASTDWFAVAAYDRDKTAPAPASGFADTLPMPTAPFAPIASPLMDDGDDNGGEWLPLPPRTTGELAEACLKLAAACAGLGFGLGWAYGMASRLLNGG